MDFILKKLSSLLIRILSKEVSSLYSSPTHTYEDLKNCIRPGDVLLVEGNQVFSSAIKYLTQSNWSHSAIYMGEEKLIEADIQEGVIELPLSTYTHYHSRICRPVGLDESDFQIVFDFIRARVGHTYDLKNIFDLARYLIPRPPIPDKWKRNILEFGSGDPTKVICSSLIAEAFQKVDYPILPNIEPSNEKRKSKKFHFRKRHPTLFAPADFDRSPYFQIIKPTIESKFDHRQIPWVDRR